MIKRKRVYDIWHQDDGFRVLVDRLWPRGLSKEKAHVDVWLKDVAPSTELRQWFGHDPEKWEEFRKKYKKELKDKNTFIRQLKDLEKQYTNITLLYGAQDMDHNEAVVLIDILK